MDIVIAAVVVAVGLLAGMIAAAMLARPAPAAHGGSRAVFGAPRVPGARGRRHRADRERSQGAPRRDRPPRGADAHQGGGARFATQRPRRSREAAERPRGGDRPRPRPPRPRARAGRRHERVAGQAAVAQGADRPGPPRRRADGAPDRGGDQARGRPARAKHPLGRHAAAGRRPRGRDDGLGRPAAGRRHEGPHHRPRGPQHPRPRAPHRRRLHHRRHARTP